MAVVILTDYPYIHTHQTSHTMIQSRLEGMESADDRWDIHAYHNDKGKGEGVGSKSLSDYNGLACIEGFIWQTMCP